MPTAAIMTFIAGSLLTLLLGIFELIKQQKSWFKIIIFFSLFLVFLGAGLYDILDKDESTKGDKKEVIEGINNLSVSVKDSVNASLKISIDSIKKAILDSIKSGNTELSAQGDSIKNAITNNRIPSEEKVAFIDLQARGEYKNPEIIYSKNGDVTCKIYFINYGNDIALNIIDDIFIVNYISGKLYYNNIYSTQMSNNTTALPPKEIAMASFGIHVPEKDPYKIKPYIYLKLSYTNSKNIKMKPLRKIFVINEKGTEELPAAEHNKIEQELKNNKLY